VVVALSTAQELGLAGVAAAFILFALLSSFVLPGRDPTFPGRRLGAFIAVTALFFVAMLTAILVLAREPEEAEGHEATPTSETATQETQTQPTESESGPQETQPAPQVEGDPDHEADLPAQDQPFAEMPGGLQLPTLGEGHFRQEREGGRENRLRVERAAEGNGRFQPFLGPVVIASSYRQDPLDHQEEIRLEAARIAE